MREWKASLRAFRDRPRIRTSPDPGSKGSGLSNTTWFAGLSRLYRGNKGFFWPKAGSFLAKAGFFYYPGSRYSRYSRVFPLHGNTREYLKSNKETPKVQYPGIHGNTGNTGIPGIPGIHGNTGNTALRA